MAHLIEGIGSTVSPPTPKENCEESNLSTNLFAQRLKAISAPLYDLRHRARAQLLRWPRLNVSPCLQHTTLNCAGLELMNRLEATYQSVPFG
eukprot:1144562-Pelagomonas_calceolata.AAC.1